MAAAPRALEDRALIRRASTLTRRLADYGWRASTGPLVWNRHRSRIAADRTEGAVRILWAADIDGRRVERSPRRDAQRWVGLRERDGSMVLSEAAVLVQRTTALEQPRRLVAAHLDRGTLASAWGGAAVVENHVNVLRCATSDSPLTPELLVALLNLDRGPDLSLHERHRRRVGLRARRASPSRGAGHLGVGKAPARRAGGCRRGVLRVKLLSREECGERLNRIFPAGVVADPRAVAGPLAAAAVYACVYCGAFQGHNPIRPSMVLWMCSGVARRAAASSPEDFMDDRERWYRAALRGHDALTGLLAEWGMEHRPWYRDNSREPLRDETFREWLRLGAMDHDASIPTTSPRPAWTLKGDFAGLFMPGLEAVDLTDAIAAWQAANLGAVGRTRIRLEGERRAAEHTVEVRLPNGSVRPLAPGDSSLILKGAPRLLGSFGVVAISQSKRKVDVSDDELLRDLGPTASGSARRSADAQRRLRTPASCSTPAAWSSREPVIACSPAPRRPSGATVFPHASSSCMAKAA